MEQRKPVGKAEIFLHTSEDMHEVEDKSAKLLIGASVFLGKGVEWKEYVKLYQGVYNEEGQRVIRKDGVFIVIQTNAYVNGTFLCRYHNILKLLFGAGWELFDERVWMRRRADHMQVPFSHVLIFRPPGGTATRTEFNRNNGWFQGVWDYPQTGGGALNSYPDGLCRMMIETTTREGDLIVDPFAGTGRLVGLAKKMSRIGIGYEIDPEMTEHHYQNGCETEYTGSYKKKGLVQ